MPRSTSKKQTLREALVARLGHPSRSRLHRLADGARKRFGPMSRAESYAVLADEHGIPLHRYLAGDELERIRRILAGALRPIVVADTASGRRKRPNATPTLKEIVIDGSAFVIGDPILPAKVAADARRMASVYPLTYIFENSVRELVVRLMQKKYGADWWKPPIVPTTVLRDVETTKRNEAKVPWHGERGRHEIHYTTIDHLKSIITTNDNWPLFKPILGEQNAISYLIQVIEQSRHTIAHHNLLSPDDINHLKVNVGAWQKLLREHSHQI